MERLTPRQQQIYDYLCSHLEDHGYPPTLREICAEFSMRSTRAASDHLQALERKGFIVRHRDRSRGIELRGPRPNSAGQRVPIYGRIAAGPTNFASPDVVDTITLDESLASQDTFMLEVHGESMIGAHICPGDLIMVKSTPDASHGDIVVAMLEDEATVKRLDRKGDTVRLLPENPDMAPIPIPDPNALKIVGKVVGLVRRMG
jgi:repressor LexA